MTHSLAIRLGDRTDLAWAQRTVTEQHYLRQPVDSRARPMVYVIDYEMYLSDANSIVSLLRSGDVNCG